MSLFLALAVLTLCIPVGICAETYEISAVTNQEVYSINQEIVFTVTTGKDVTRIKIFNEDGTIYNFASISSGFKEYQDTDNKRIWTLKKRAQMYFRFQKTVIVGDDSGYFGGSAVVSYYVGNAKPGNTSGFLKASGSMIIDSGTNEPFLIKGMSLGNCVYDNPSVPPQNHHTEESYKELSELGFNSVRFYLNYGIFEDDSAPYVYKRIGWDWLDKNIEWAKKYNIKLILNMHYPQGKYQSNGGGMELWTLPENQDRLTALWTAIAERYSDETAIGGYGLVNEPVVPALDTPEKTIAQWQNLAQRITDSIRTVDQNHLVFVERVNGIKALDGSEIPWELLSDYNGNKNYFLIDDDNVVYEFHTYEPFFFTHQYVSWSSFSGITAVYPDAERIVTTGGTTWMTSSFNNPVAADSSQWQYLKGEKFKVDNENYPIWQAVLQIFNTGENGKVWFDDITVREYDENGAYTRDLQVFTFDSSDDISSWGMWSADGKGSFGYDSSAGHDGAGCVWGGGTAGDANIGYSSLFATKQGYSYEISGYVKTENLSADSIVRLRTDFWDSDNVMTADKEYLEYSLKELMNFGIENNVPLYLGEFGVDCYGFMENRGGDVWVNDMLDLCDKYNLNFNYHTYHETSFGLYTNDQNKLPDGLNTVLYNVFKDRLKIMGY